MKAYSFFLILFCLILSGSCAEQLNPEFKVLNLKCEYMVEAVVAKLSPRFSWEITSTENGQEQTAWQLIVSDDLRKLEANNGNIWDSGKTKGNEIFGIKWQGNQLKSFTKYHWKVRVWDHEGKVSDWSEAASFITGAFDKKDWKANWIGDHPEAPLDYPLLYKHIGYHSAYAEQADEEKWVQIDLGEIKGFDKVSLYPSHQNRREIIDYYLDRKSVV